MTRLAGQCTLRSFAGDTALITWQGRSRGTLVGWRKGLTGTSRGSTVTNAMPSILGRKIQDLIPARGSTGYRAAAQKNAWSGLIIFYYDFKEQSDFGEGFQRGVRSKISDEHCLIQLRLVYFNHKS